MTELLLTLRLSALTTLILLVVGLPLAYWLAFSRWRWKPFVEATIALPLVLPPTVLGFYFLLLLGRNGWVGQAWFEIFRQPLAFSFTGLVIVSVFYSLPFAVQPLHSAFQGLNPRLIEAAETLGASRVRTFWRVILPSCRSAVLSAVVLSFAHTMGEFGVVLMVGGNIPGETRTLSIAIYDLVEALEYAQANQLSFILLVFSYAVLATLYILNRKGFQSWKIG
ncbi:Molybdenum transport system permease protein ModB [compost metagenome]